MTSKTAMLEMIAAARRNLLSKSDIKSKYACETLNKCEDYIKTIKPTKPTAKKYETIKWSHRGVECIDALHKEFGDECTYIYCMMQVYKHLYSYEYDKNDDDRTAAEWYNKMATTIESKHKNDPEWVIKK